MGRRLNLSTPTVIQSELIPLNESFYIESSGATEQWFYDNTSTYAPNRKITPLILTPKLSLSDGDTGQSYNNPHINLIKWFVNQYDPTTDNYVETEITNVDPSNPQDFCKDGNSLIVRCNVSYTHAITLRCLVQYADPRDAGVAYQTSDSVTLITNRDASVVFPKVDILAPSAQSFNPLVDNVSEFEMQAIADWTGIADEDVMPYKVDPNGTEEILPQNTTDIVNCAPYLDIRYADTLLTEQEFLFRPTAGGAFEQIDGSLARVENVGGKSIAWNQLLDVWRLRPQETSALINGVTWTKLEDGSIMANGTASGSSQFTIYSDSIESGFKGIANHKYYCYTVKGGSTQTYYGTFISNGGGISGTTEKFISTCIDGTKGGGIILRVNDGVTVSNVIFKPMLIDLTAIFGAGNEPSTVAEFESWLAKNVGLRDYNPYSDGNFANVKMTGLKTTGFNQWDEEWEEGNINITDGSNVAESGIIRSKNLIPVSPNTDYYYQQGINGGSNRICYYDASKNFVSGNASLGTTFTTPNNAQYVRFSARNYGSTYNNDICINISDPQRNGTYEPYWSETKQIPVTTLTGKKDGTGAATAMFQQGMNGIEDLRDEINTTGIERNVPTAVPTLGDPVFINSNSEVIIVDKDTLYAPKIPAAWTYIGDVIDTVGEDKVKILNKDFSSAKYLDVCQYSITAISSTSLTINLRMSPNYAVDTTVNVTLTSATINATSAQEISDAVAAKATEVGDTKDWWAYLADANGNKVTTGGTQIIIQCDTCVDYRFYIVSATGCTISHTTWGDMPANNNAGTRASGLTSDAHLMNIVRGATYYATNGITPSANVALNAAGNPVKKDAFLTSEYCATLRDTYKTYENYLEQEYKVVYPQSTGVFSLPDGKTLTETYGDLTAPTKSGGMKYKFPALHYARIIGYNATNLTAGNWYLCGVQEGCVFMSDGNLSILNNVRKKTAGTQIANSSPRWFAQRYNVNVAWFFYGHIGTLDSHTVNNTNQVGAVSLYKFK